MKYLSILIILFNLTLVSFAQNLVPNEGFDNYAICPTQQNQLVRASPWYNPSVFPSTPDFFHQCNNGNMGVPLNVIGGYQNGHTVGGGYVGCVVFVTMGSDPNSREYAQVELIDSLIDSSYYCVSFYVSRANRTAIAVSDIGLHISDSAIFLTSNTFMPVHPQIFNPDTNILIDTLNWIEVSGIYQAHGGEKFITIGNFHDSLSTHPVIVDTSMWNAGYRYAYYLIDDVSVINCDSLFNGINEVNLNAVTSIYPNPVINDLNVDFNGYAMDQVEICLYNSMGQKVTANYYGWIIKAKIDLGTLVAGIYIVEIKCRDGIVRKKVIKQ